MSHFDLIAGEDVEIKYLPELHLQDDFVVELQQGRDQCAVVAPYTGILSLYNLRPNDSGDFINSVFVGKKMTLKHGVHTTCKARNEMNPENKVMYAQLEIGSKEFKEVLKRNYPIVMGCHLTVPYIRGQRDGLVTTDRTGEFVFNHAMVAYKSDKYDRKHVNHYPHREHNTFEVEHGYKLADAGVYARKCYVILPENDLAGKLKAKYTKVLGYIALKIKSLSVEGDSSYDDAKRILSILK